jgi:hypothetical protein
MSKILQRKQDISINRRPESASAPPLRASPTTLRQPIRRSQCSSQFLRVLSLCPVFFAPVRSPSVNPAASPA